MSEVQLQAALRMKAAVAWLKAKSKLRRMISSTLRQAGSNAGIQV